MGVVAFRSIDGHRTPDPVLASDQITPAELLDIQRFRVGYAQLWKKDPALARFILNWSLFLLDKHGCLPPPSS